MPLFGSTSGWTPPSSFPNLAGVKEIALDTETFDPGLMKDEGPDPVNGYVVGISIAVPERSWYFPIAHEMGMNMDRENVLKYVQDSVKGRRIIGANCTYDAQFLEAEGLDFSTTSFFDVQYAATLLDETHKSYSLNACAWRDLGMKKDEDDLVNWIMKATRCKKKDAKGYIYLAPSDVVGPYAEVDAELPLLLKQKYVPELKRQGLIDVAAVEMGLIPLLVEMRKRGIRVDIEKAERVRGEILKKIQTYLVKWKKDSGFWVDIWSTDSLLNFFSSQGIFSNRKTATGKDSFTKEWFMSFPDGHIVREVGEVRKLDKLNKTFIESYVLKKSVNGRVHCQFHPLRRGDGGDESSTDGGTISGRFSSSDPNLQNIPYRDPFAGPLMRSFFIPDEGDDMGCIDYSQIEYRVLAHCAVGQGADYLRDRFNQDPTVDYHELTRQIIHEKTGQMLSRSHTKNINFGFVYGMSERKLCQYLGLEESEGAELFVAYHGTFPFVKKTADTYVQLARRNNEIRTELGRRRSFNLYGPRRGWAPPLPYDKAVEMYGEVTVQMTHKSLNAYCQGTAADVIKKAMLNLFKAGLTSGAAKLLLTVHDELVFSLNRDSSKELLSQIKFIMETALPLRVPVLADAKIGSNWKEAK